MKYVKAGLLLLFVLAVGIFVFFKVKSSGAGLSDPPVIEDSIDSFHVNCDYTDEDLLRGLTATDDEDGDITDQIMTGEFTPLKDGNTSTYNCVVFDSDGQYVEYNRPVTFDDYEHPTLGLSKSLLYYTDGLSPDKPRALLSASDKLDGDITYRIQLSDSNVDYEKIGDYLITVTVDNSFGDSVNYELPVHVRYKPSILYVELRQYLVYCDIGSAFDPMEYIKTTSNDRAVSESPFELSVKSNVDTRKPGVYEVEYTLSGGDIIPSETEFLTVIVSK